MKTNRLLIVLFILVLLISCYSKKESITKKTQYDIQDFITMINKNDINEIQNCIHENFNIHETIGENKITFLDYAIKENKEEISLILISNGIDVNHVDKTGKTSFYKAIGHMSPNLLDAFLEHGVNYRSIVHKNMNYFVYMLYKRDYSIAYNFITHNSVFEYLKNDKNLIINLIYYWNSDWSPEIGNFLIQNKYQFSTEEPYYFYAIDEYSLSAVKWLESIGIKKSEKYYEERYNLYFTPYEYAENKYLEMSNFLGKDYAYSQDDDEVLAIREIINYLNDN